jgi:hypothetical protein
MADRACRTDERPVPANPFPASLPVSTCTVPGDSAARSAKQAFK